MNPQLNNRLKIYTRLDASNNRIAGSSVQRLVMPKVGKWVEDTPFNACCFPFTELTYTPSDVTDDNFTLTILCDATTMLLVKVITDTATTTIDELVDALNSQLSYLGAFATDGSDITFKLKSVGVSDNWNCDGTLSFTIIPT